MRTTTIAIFTVIALLTLSAFEKDATKTGFEIGNKIPEISAKSLNGKEIQLSSLKGKLVLVDFWASWCGPCRIENPHIVHAYNKYKDMNFKNGTGFTIYSFSLDTKADRWENAINKDKLSWEYHVSELSGWHSPTAKRFQIDQIPANFLIDGDGIILAKDLRGEKLERVLEYYVKKPKQ